MTDKVDEIRREHFGVSDEYRAVQPDDKHNALIEAVIQSGAELKALQDRADSEEMSRNPRDPVDCACGEVIDPGYYAGICTDCGRRYDHNTADGSVRFSEPDEPTYTCKQDEESEMPTDPAQPDTRDEDREHWADGLADVCTDMANEMQRMTDEMRERQRMMLVDGFPGEWKQVSNYWFLRLPTKTKALVKVYRDDELWHGMIKLDHHWISQEKVTISESVVVGYKSAYKVARALKPKAERLVACLEGLGDE
jgi:hypothetical protein